MQEPIKATDTAAQAPSPAVQASSINRKFVYPVSLVGAIGGLLFGFTMHMIIGAVIFIKEAFQLTPTQLGFAVSCATVGCMVGAVTAGSLADRLGRKKALAVTALIFVFGTVGTTLARTVAQFDGFRMLSGLGVGVVSVVAPMYNAEISPAALRGRLVSVYQLLVGGAGFLSIVVAYRLAPTANWRGMFASALVPVLLLLIVLMFVPESPRWLVEKNRLDDARKVLARVYTEKGAVSRELSEIAASFSTQGSSSVRELFRPGVRTALIIGVALAAFVQFTGVSALSWYMPLIFQRAGFTNATDAMFQTLIINAWSLLCGIAAMFIVDRAGRRPLLLIGTIGITASMAATGILFAFPAAPGGLIVLTSLLAMGFFNFSLAPMFWLLISEIFPTAVRGKGMAASSLAQWISAFLAAQTFPMLIAYSEQKFNMISPVFWLFAAISAGAFVFSYRLVPETRGRTLEQIGASWETKEQTIE